MASLNYRTRGTTSVNRAQKKAHVKPAELRNNQEYLKAYKGRTEAHNKLFTAREALKRARKRLKNHYDYESMDLAMREGQHRHKLDAAQRKKQDDIIQMQLGNIPKHHSDFAAAHQKMRDMEHEAGITNNEHRLARTSTFPNRGQMYGKFGIYNINASHIAEKDKMEPVEGDHQYYMKGGRRKKTRKKRRRKNKRKTKRRKKTRRRKKRRKKRRTKRR